MYSKKVILWPVAISFVAHAALISASSFIDLRDSVKAAEIITVKLEEPQENKLPKKENPAKDEKRQVSEKGKEIKISADDWREDTVDLGSRDSKYGSFLVMVRKKIMTVFMAFKNQDQGTVSIRMSVDSDGSLAQVQLISSSGSINLDEGTLMVIRSAAPFTAFPKSYDISRLNIDATFNYH